jgi:hypothetical protein
LICPTTVNKYNWKTPGGTATTATTATTANIANTTNTFTLTSGLGCQIVDNGKCFQSINYPNNHGADQSCSINVSSSTNLDVKDFDVEASETCEYDHLTVNGTKYCGTTGPNGTSVNGGDTINWITDSSVESKGFKICASEYTRTSTRMAIPTISEANNEFTIQVQNFNEIVVSHTVNSGWELDLTFDCTVNRITPMDIMIGTIKPGSSSLDELRTVPKTAFLGAAAVLNSYVQVVPEPGTQYSTQIISNTYVQEITFVQDYRIFQNVDQATFDIALGGLLRLNFTETLNCSAGHYYDPTFLYFTKKNSTTLVSDASPQQPPSYEVHVHADSNMTGAAMVSCQDNSLVFQLSKLVLNELQLGDPPLPNPLPTYNVSIRPSYGTVRVSTKAVPVVLSRSQNYSNVPVLLDAGAPCISNIAMELNSDVLVLTFDEKIVPTSSLANSLVYGTHFTVDIDSGSSTAIAVGSNVQGQAYNLVKVEGTRQQYSMRVKLDHGIRPTGNELVNVVLWPSSSTKDAPANAGLQDLWNNEFCSANEWPKSLLQIPVTLSRLPGIIVAPLSVTIGEASNDGVEGYGAYITVRLDTPPNDADVHIALSSSRENQIVFSNQTIVFEHGADTWSEGIQVQIFAVQDNTPETEQVGESHQTQILFAVDSSSSSDSIYNENLVAVYGK